MYDFYGTIANRIWVRMDKKFEIYDRMKRVDDSDLDRVVRETILNVLVHANYCSRGRIVVELHPDSLTVSNSEVFCIPMKLAAQGEISDPRDMTL